MKKLILLLFLIATFHQSADAQWYYKKFGVRSLDVLNKSQLDMSLKYMLDQRRKTIITYSVIASATAAGGAMLMYKANKSGSGEGSGMISAVGATLLVISTAGIVSAAVTEITIQSVRISKVRKALSHPQIHPGVSCIPMQSPAQIQTVPIYGLTISVNL
jgi:hypothetical protein